MKKIVNNQMREAGILLHISSLPSKYGIGSFGESAYKFVDFLNETNQSYWQILPIGPTSFGNSPYQSYSINAINPYFIDLDLLVKDNLLKDTEIIECNNQIKVDYNYLFLTRLNLLYLAYERFDLKNNEYLAFLNDNNWVEDYSLFISLKEFYHHVSFNNWPSLAKLRDITFLNNFKLKNLERINFHKFLQFIAHKQYFSLKSYANNLGIKIIGDIPIYISYDSVDLWINPNLFLLDENLEMEVVAGVPPDSFSSLGQVWGNPLYNWNTHKQDNYLWWTNRIKTNNNLFDLLRIDHFIGFENYFSIDNKTKDAKTGKWNKGPGINLFNALNENLGPLNLIAEDLGVLTDDVRLLLKNLNYPGMKVLQFAFNDDFTNEYLPHNYGANTITYTATHDNLPSKAWFKQLDLNTKRFVLDYLNANQTNIVESLIKEALKSNSKIVIIPIQDYLNLGLSSRMNEPSTIGDNWTFKLNKNHNLDEIKGKIIRLTEISGRNKNLDF